MENPGEEPDPLPVLAALQADFAASIPGTDPTARLPWCGDWSVADLVDHLTEVHHWATALTRDVEEVPLAPDPDRQARYRRAAAALCRALAERPADTPTATLVPGGTVAFWRRRQTHETLVHLWDLRAASGLPTAAPAGLWADTVDEALTIMHPRQIRLGRTAGAPRPLEVVADDVGRRWTLGPTDRTTGPVATVRGPAEAVALLLWGRIDRDDQRLSWSGDRQLFAATLADRFLP